MRSSHASDPPASALIAKNVEAFPPHFHATEATNLDLYLLHPGEEASMRAGVVSRRFGTLGIEPIISLCSLESVRRRVHSVQVSLRSPYCQL